MAASLIASALSRFGKQLLQELLERVRAISDPAEMVEYALLERRLEDVLTQGDIEAAFERAYQQFRGYSSVNERWMQTFEHLLRHGGESIRTFCYNLWLTFLFRLPEAGEALWDLYPKLQQTVTVETQSVLPHHWGEWIPPLQAFMDLAEGHLVEENPFFEELFASAEVQQLLEGSLAPPTQRGAPSNGQPFATLEGRFNAAAFAAYLSACFQRMGHIDPRGYPRSVHSTLPLSDVYIPLPLVRLPSGEAPHHLIRYQIAGYDDPQISAFREPLIAREMEGRASETVYEVLSRHQLVLILGGVGAGKTTLLRHLVLEQARLLLEAPPEAADGDALPALAHALPLYVDLAEYCEEHYPDETLEEYLLRSAAQLAQDEDVVPLLAGLLQNGQCLILLDGLDQAASDDQRRLLVANVARASATWRATGNRVVVTSRFSGYATTPLPPEFVAYVIRPPERTHLDALLLRWRQVLLRLERPLMGDDEVIRQAHSDMLTLARQITGNPALRAVLNSPLLLRLLAGIYRPGMVVPAQAVAIYQQAAEALTREWRLPQGATARPTVLEQEITPLLGELAFWLQSARPTGLVSEQELREILGRIWGEMHPQATPEQVNAAIGDFMGRVRVHPGVLMELAPQRYGFAYRGLQEYYAARYLVTGYLHAAQRIRERLHDPRWDEVIALAIAYMALHSLDDASALIEAAVLARGRQAVQFGHASSPFESLLKRDLFYAARLLGSGVEVRADLARYVVEQLMDLWLHGDRNSLGRFSLIFDNARRYLIDLEGTSSSHLALQVAKEHLQASDEYVQAFAVDALTFWPSHLEEGRHALATLTHEAPLMVRRALANALKHMGTPSQEAYMLLLRLAGDPDEQVSLTSQQALEGVASIPPGVLALWVNYLRSGDLAKQRIALRWLQSAGSLPPQVIGELLRLLGDPNLLLRRRAVEALAHVPNLSADALGLLTRLAASADPPIRVAAIGALARPVELPTEIIEQLVRWSDDSDPGVRQAAIHALETCQNDSREVIDALLERLDDPADSIRAGVMEALARKGGTQPRVQHMLARMVDDPIYSVREALARALRLIPEPSDEVRRILQILLNEREPSVREAALETVRYLRVPGDEITDYLIVLATTPNHPHGLQAAHVLASLRGLREEALLALLEALRLHGEQVAKAVADCLQAHVPLPPAVTNALMDMALSSNNGAGERERPWVMLRGLALEMLGYTLDHAPAAMQVLLNAARASEPLSVRLAALRGLAYTRTASPGVLHELRGLLNNGPFEVRCQAAVTLGHLIRNLPDPYLTADEMMGIARHIADMLYEVTPRAAWEADSRIQNELLWALSWIVERARPGAPRLAARSEELHGKPYEQRGDW